MDVRRRRDLDRGEPGHTYAQAGQYTARLSVSDGANTTLSTPIDDQRRQPADARRSSTPQDGVIFRAGDVISFSGDATDPEDGTLPASAFTWNIDFLHEGHVHPGHTADRREERDVHDPDDRSRLQRQHALPDHADRDRLGRAARRRQSVIIWPQKVNLTFDTVPTGLTLYLDGIAKTTPFVYDTLVGFNHTIEARNQSSGHDRLHVRLVVGRRRAAAHDRRAEHRRRPTPRPTARLASGDAGLRPGGQRDAPDTAEHGRDRPSARRRPPAT